MLSCMKTFTKLAAGLAVGALIAVAQPAAADNHGHADMAQKAAGNLAEVAVGNGNFKTLVKALDAAGLVETVATAEALTVFAPTDAAFEKLPEGTLESLLANPDQLKQVLLYHVVPGKVTSDQVVSLESAKTVQGEPVKIAVKDNKVMINNATVAKADVMASNGVIHVIDTVILPPSMQGGEEAKTIAEIAAGNEDFSTLVTALQKAELVDALNGEGPFTVFAPTNAAFAKLPEATLNGLLNDQEALKGVLLYHVVPGKVTADKVTGLSEAKTLQGDMIKISTSYGTVKINDARVIKTDIMGSNGVIHVIDSVIVPGTPGG